MEDGANTLEREEMPAMLSFCRLYFLLRVCMSEVCSPPLHLRAEGAPEGQNHGLKKCKRFGR